jgi:AraC-like DNA-binding protein
MTTSRRRNRRTFTHDHRQRLQRAAENYLRDCYRKKQPARGKDFADSLDLTPEYVSWLGAQVLGGSLHDYLRRRQVAYAERLLRTTPLSVEEVAVRSGFGTRSTMHRWFLAVHQLTPAAFRALKK